MARSTPPSPLARVSASSSTSRILVAEIRRRITPELHEIVQAGRDLEPGAHGQRAGVPSLEPLRRLVKRMRLARVTQRAAAIEAVCTLLEEDAELGAGVRAYASRIALSARTSSALADLGLLPSHGLFAELRQRLFTRLLPSHRPPHELTELLRSVFDPIDAEWLETVDDAQLVRLLGLFTPDEPAALQAIAHGALRAIDLLAHRLAAAGEDPVLFDFDPAALDFESPFLAQAEHVLLYTAGLRAQIGLEPTAPAPEQDDRQARVLLSQCRDATTRIRRRTPRTGATIRLTYELERIDDLIDRLVLLLDTVADVDVALPARAQLFRRLVRAQVEIEQIAPLLRRGSTLVASEIVSHAGRTGEHYIARTRGEYGTMWLAAGGAGLVVACMAGIKVGLASIGAPPLVEAALFSANYAIGFALVQSLGMTIATKQPAMTAAALASSIDVTRPKDTRGLVETIQCLARSQLAAILGNCLVALPAALALSAIFALVFGAPIASVEKAHHLLEEIDPLRSLAIPHAAITGLWLTTSAIAAGYASSSVMARHVPERIRRSRALLRRLGVSGRERLAHFAESSAGALVGSIVLGILLGSTGTIGRLLGLPIDIRHVSFASANLGLAIATLGLDHVHLGRSLAGIAGIGATNLAVSFSLSLGLALHARRARLRDLPTLAGDLLRSSVRELPSWVLPVGASAKAIQPEET
jgi:site-specific recombinase